MHVEEWPELLAWLPPGWMGLVRKLPPGFLEKQPYLPANWMDVLMHRIKAVNQDVACQVGPTASG